jgi:hypothetical protein
VPLDVLMVAVFATVSSEVSSPIMYTRTLPLPRSGGQA